jgi:hypothetical protein
MSYSFKSHQEIWTETKELCENINRPDLIRERYDVKLIEEVSKVTRFLLDFSNVMGSGTSVAEGMLDGIIRTHRTIQADFITNLINTLEAYGDSATDPRNQGAVAQAKRMATNANNWEDDQ